MIHQKSFQAIGKKACKETLKVYLGTQPDALDISNGKVAGQILLGRNSRRCASTHTGGLFKENGMKNFAFISRHIPTEGQINLAESLGIRLITIGDMNAFTIDTNSIMELGVENETPFDGVIVVHPAAALRLAGDFLVGVFENSNRAPVGQPPQFEAVSLHISAIFEDRTARQRLAAELIVARIERNQRLRRLQDQAIKRADRRRLHRAMLSNGALFVIAAVAIFSIIWWCGL